MAGRKIKEGLNYFSLDIDFFDDLKILKIEETYGMEGTYVAIRLLSLIYRNSYYLEWNGEDSITYAKKIGNNLTSSRLQDIVLKLLKIKFFDQDIYDKFSILTSKGIQSRWMDVNERSNRKATVNFDYNLLDVKSNEKPKKSDNLPEKSEEMPEKSNEKLKKSEGMQRIKVKEIKEKKGKGNAISSDLKSPEISSEKPETKSVVEDEETEYQIPEKLQKISGLVELIHRYMRLRNEQYKPINPMQSELLIMDLLDMEDPVAAVKRALIGNDTGRVYLRFYEEKKKTNGYNGREQNDKPLYSHLKPPDEAIDMRD